ncbi:hypothetical protein A2U01_0000304 [Trifolium medium]|uniref:Uncharacterized protein n=1 Tax=Trifolium medium TaxID=97028 RepID=A0A392LX69_9FABA|nr:hypothetical protein [Trifolium medium]
MVEVLQRNSVPTMYTSHVPNTLKVAYRVPEFVPRTEVNCEPEDEEGAYAAKDLLQRQGMSRASWKAKTSEKTNLGAEDTKDHLCETIRNLHWPTDHHVQLI